MRWYPIPFFDSRKPHGGTGLKSRITLFFFKNMIRNSTTTFKVKSFCRQSTVRIQICNHIISYHMSHIFCYISYVQHHIMPFQFVFPCLSTLATYISEKASKMWREPNVDSRLLEERFHGECGALHELSKCKSPQMVSGRVSSWVLSPSWNSCWCTTAWDPYDWMVTMTIWSWIMKISWDLEDDPRN